MKKLIICLIALVYTTAVMKGQITGTTNVEIKPETPNSAQFSRYDQMTISEYTGIPNISVPLYNIDLDGVKVPLNLTYQAGGIKADQEASWVGLGWDLSLGYITQIINGEDDIKPYHLGTVKVFPDYQPSNYYFLQPFPWNYIYDYSHPGIDTLPICKPELKYGYRVAFNYFFPVDGKYRKNEPMYQGKVVDSEPDLFIVNLLGDRVHFIQQYDKNNPYRVEIKILNKKGYSIKSWYTAPYTEEWEVINPQGVKFYFVEKIETDTYTHSYSNRDPGSSHENRSKRIWLLNKIVTTNGRQIEIKYGKTDEIEQQFFSQIGEERTSVEDDIFDIMQMQDYLKTDILTNYQPAGTTHIKTIVKEPQYYLSEITFIGGSVIFNTSGREDIAGSQKLDSISVKWGDSPVRNITFDYDYFADNEGDGKRLKLKSLDVNRDNYSFKYNPTQLPAKNSYAVDYWGYHNGHTANTSYIPNPSRFKEQLSKHIDNGNNKSANEPYTKSCILEEIIYPTGGSTKFDYELNEFGNYWVPDYSTTDNKTSKGYGLRLKNLTYTNNDKVVKAVSYEYLSGKSVVPQAIVQRLNYKWIVLGQTGQFRQMFYDNIVLLSTSGASNVTPFSSHTTVGYDTVICVSKDAERKINGRTVMTFHNNPHKNKNLDLPQGGYYIVNLPSYKYPDRPENGSLRNISYYDENNKLIKEKKYEYKNIVSDIYYGTKISGLNSVLRFWVRTDSSTPEVMEKRHLLSFYPVYDLETLTSKEEEINYLNDSIHSSKEYTYDDYNRLSTVITNTSKGINLEEEFLYPSGVSSTLLLPKNRYREIVAINKYLNNNQIYYSNKNYILSGGLVLVDRIDEGPSKDLAKSINLSYTAYGRLQQKQGADGKYTTYFWDNSFLYPTTEIKNASYQQVIEALAGVNPDGSLANSPDFSKIDDLRFKLSQAQVTTFSYRPLIGMLSATDPRGQVTKYDYDGEGRLKTIYLSEDGKDKLVKRYEYGLPGYNHIPVDPENPDPNPEPSITPDPYKKGKASSVLINIGAKGDGSYGLTGWNYDTQKVELNNVITKTYKTIEASEYQWTTENLRLKYGTYGSSINMNWVNLTQADVDKYSADYLNNQKIPLEEFEQVFGTWASLYSTAMMYRNIYWGVPTGGGTFDHTWGLPTKEDIWQMYGQAPRTTGNVYEDIKDFLFASACDNKYNWTQNMFNRRNISGLTLTPLGMRESVQGGAIYGFGQVASLQTAKDTEVETLSDRDLSGNRGIISNPYTFHFTQARHRRPMTDQELGYKMYIDVANDQIQMLPYNQASTLPELAKGLERGIALRYANREHMKVLKKWSEIQTEAKEIRSKLAPTNYPAPPALLPCEKEPEPEVTADPYTKGKEGAVLINIGARGDGSYTLAGWNYDTQKVEQSNVITKTYKTIEASEYQWTTENLRLKYGNYVNTLMDWANLTQADVNKYSSDYLSGKTISLDEFEQVYGSWATLYETAMMYRNIYWGVPTGAGTFDHTWGLPYKEDIWQMYGQAPRTSNNLYNDIKDFLFASPSDFNFGWTQGLFNNKNTSGLTLTPLGMRESYNGGAIYGFGQVTSLQTGIWKGIETLSDRDLSGNSGLISNANSYHFTQARHRRPLTDQELGYKMYIDAANDQVLMLPYTVSSALPELPKGVARGVALRYANRKALKVVKKWSEIQAEAAEIISTITK